MKRMLALLFGVFLMALRAGAQEPPAQTPEKAEARIQALEERVRQLEEIVRTLKAAVGTVTPAESSAPTQAAPPAPVAAPVVQSAEGAQLPRYGGATSGSKIFNPDISVIGNFLGATGKNNERPVPALEMAETELGLQAIIDPYARADVFLSFGESGVDLEEGYLTFTSLPGGFVGKVGKMRALFGKVNTLHTHNLPWTDRPLVTENLLGGDEGISDAGLSVSRILPAPGGLFLEGTAQVYRGDSEELFQSSRKQDLLFVGHIRGYRDLGESTNVDLGFSYARGHNDQGSDFITNLYGIDATLRWKPLRRAIYKSFLARAEFVWSQRDQLPFAQRAFGLYASGEYRLNRRWTLGGRYDQSDRAQDASLTDRGFSALLTYWPSEFSQIRGQYRFARYAGGQDANELRFQFLFVMGAHGAHPF
jgi:hypothetical protein